MDRAQVCRPALRSYHPGWRPIALPSFDQRSAPRGVVALVAAVVIVGRLGVGRRRLELALDLQRIVRVGELARAGPEAAHPTGARIGLSLGGKIAACN